MKQQKKITSIQFKILLPTAAVVIALSLILGITSYLSIQNGMVSMGVEEAAMAATAAMDVIDGDLLADITPGSEDSQSYLTLLTNLRRVQKNFGIAYLYTLYTDGSKVYYGVDTDETENQTSVGELFEVSYEELEEVFNGSTYAQDYIDHTEDGELISVYRPIKDSSGKIVGILGCDYDASGVLELLHKTILRTVLIALFSMLAALILVGLIVQNIMYGLNQISEKVSNLANSDGDLSQKLEVDTGDELETIADNVNAILGQIYEQAAIANKVAAGDLTVKVVPRSGNDLLGTSLQQLVERNSDTLRGISNAANQAQTGAAQVARASEALAQGSTEQAGAIEEITASINNVSDMIRQSAHDAEQAASLISLSVDNVKKGNQEMMEMMNSMEAINASSENISQIIKTIDDIAFQTNILALNASVEAARAGDAGKGFAVVAGEIRNLANKSAEAAANTEALIQDSIQKTKRGMNNAAETERALGDITNAVSQSGEIIHAIARVSGEQVTSITEINRAVEQISEVVQTNSAASEQCASASLELTNQMNHVNRMLSVYRLE